METETPTTRTARLLRAFQPKRRTLRGALVHALVVPVVATAGLGIGMASGHVSDTPASSTVQAPRTVAPGQAELEAMTASGECWGNDGKAHPYPTRAWVAVLWSGAGDMQYVLRGQRVVDQALSGTGNHTVARYCR